MDNSGAVEFTSIVPNSLNDPFFNIPISDVDIGRESIPILDMSTSFGRESLGILKIGCELNNGAPKFNFSNISEVSSNNLLDQGFLISSRRASDFRSMSTYSMNSLNFSQNINNLDQPSSIGTADSFSSIQYNYKDSMNKLNDGFLYNTLNTAPMSQIRSRFNSLPVYRSEKNEIESVIQRLIKGVSEGCEKDLSVLKNKSIEDESAFSDSVFIEARHLTAKFSEEGSNDGFILDETDPPELINGDLDESKGDKKCDSKDVFRKIDKLLPADGYQKLNEKLGSQPQESSKQSPSAKLDTDNCDNKESNNNIEVEHKTPCEEIDSSLMKTMSMECAAFNAGTSKEILKTLSDILAKDNISDKETEQGQNLINTLSNILGCKSRERSKSFADSSIKSLSGTDETHIKSLNNSSQADNSTKNSSLLKKYNSFSLSSKGLKSKLATSLGRSSSFDAPKNKSSMNNTSETSLEPKNLSGENTAINLRMKKSNSASARKGPMKATVPLGNFTKPQPKETPPKVNQKMSKLSSKISTPIREVQLRPMAQSTPDNKMDRSSIEQPNIRSFSSSNIQEKSINNSSSATSLSSYKDSSMSKDRSSLLQRSHLPRRNSVSEGRRSSLSMEVKRSNSMKDTGLMKAMSKIRQNMSGSPIQTKVALQDCSNVSKNGSNGSGKLTNTPRRMVTTLGKENA